jgi:DNA mismatch repair protein MutS
MTIHDEYLFYQEKYEKKYGKDKIIVFLQVGSFHEAYATETRGYKLSEISSLLNLTLTRKDKSIDKIDESNPYMLGFPSIALRKYSNMLLEAGYTVVVYSQVTQPPNPKRELIGVYSPGTYLEEAFSPDSNNIVSIFIDYEKQLNGQLLMCVGLSRIDLSTGENSVHETYDKTDDKRYALDETVRFINSFSPKEILIHHHISGIEGEFTKDQLVSYLELDDRYYRYYDKIEKNYSKITYQNQFLEKIWPEHGLLTVLEYIDLEKNPYGIISYIANLDYAYQHDEKLIKHISKPDLFQNKKHLILGNNAVHQLNILDSFKGHRVVSNRYKSLFDVVNHTSTPMGRRLLKTMLTTPMISHEMLEKYYEWVSESIPIIDQLEEPLKGILDLERMHRKISLNMIHPYELYNLYDSYQEIQILFHLINNNKDLNSLQNLLPDVNLHTSFDDFLTTCESTFDMAILKKYNLSDMSTSFFKKGIHKDVDVLQQKIDDGLYLLNNICVILSKFIDDKPSRFAKKKKSLNEDGEEKEDDQKIHLRRNDSEGYFLNLTPKRAENLRNKLKTVESIKINDNLVINSSTFEFKGLAKGNTKIFFNELRTTSTNLSTYNEKISKIIDEKYKQTISMFYQKYSQLFKFVDRFVATLDYIKSNAKVAKLYNYTRPKILLNNGIAYKNSCIKAMSLRHPIIERLKTDTEYVPHDISLGHLDEKDSTIDGMLIYGHNFCGKSSLMKAIGLSVVMAQAGMFVPATKYEFSPYDSLFARITGDDDLFKGLSSFGLEMTELKAILKRTGSKTLVIGDEVCRGTEHISGNAIVASTIISLAKTGSSFIFATHLHDIADMERIKALKNVKCFHLSVHHDTEKDILIFDRRLREGSGEPIYGVMVARYIIDDPEFNKLTQEIKNELMNGHNKLLSDKRSKYNKKVFMDCCSVCQKQLTKGDHTHHINYQKNCKDGFVISKPHMKMNDKANLAPLCEECHEKTHHNKIDIIGYEETSKGRKLKYKLLETDSESNQKDKVRKYTKTDITKVIKFKEDGVSQGEAQKLLKKEHGLNISTPTIKKIWLGKY